MVREVPGYFAFFGGYEAARQGFAKCYGCAKKDIGIVGKPVRLLCFDDKQFVVCKKVKDLLSAKRS